jgi:GNAT superfamily N-acetyltransferase
MSERDRARQIVRSVLAADLACSDDAFFSDGVTIAAAEDRPGRRGFPRWSKPLGVVTLGRGVVVSSHPDRIPWLRATLGHLSRDAVFSAATLRCLAEYVEPDGQRLAGPDTKYVCTATDLRLADPPAGVEIQVVRGEAVQDLYRYPGFENALAYRANAARPDVLAVVATETSEPVGIAGASADCDALWQIGVDVAPENRGQGIGRAVVSRLTREVLDRGRLPYYSAFVANVASHGVATAVGYWPMWIEVYARDVRKSSEMSTA